MRDQGDREWYRLPREEVYEILRTGEEGLSDDEAAARRAKLGANVLSDPKKTSFVDRIVDELKNPLAFVLLSAGIITTLIREYVDSTVIFIALIINVAISLYQQGRADRAFVRLRDSQEKYATVIRAGEKRRTLARELVPGDVIEIPSGMNVPADARIITATRCEVNESSLTGEWIDVTKEDVAYDRLLPLSERKNMLYMGTLVTSGVAVAVVVATGDRTEFGSIATALKKPNEAITPLQENIAHIARFLSYIVIGALVVIFVLGMLRDIPLAELLLISIAIAVAAIPEGMPAAVTVSLAIGMEAILRRGGLVRNLLAAETLGSTTVIMTDKTGTLTKGEMHVAHIATFGSLHTSLPRGSDISHDPQSGDEHDLLRFATLASDAYIEHSRDQRGVSGDTVVGRPVERAIVSAALESSIDQRTLLRDFPRIEFLPFSSDFPVAMSLHRVRGLASHRLYVSGAPEFLLTHASLVYIAGRAESMSEAARNILNTTLSRYASDGLRVIAVAYREGEVRHLGETGGDRRRKELLRDLVFVGFIVFRDPLREDAASSISEAQAAGTRVIMVTGDNPETARSIAFECGIWHEGDLVLSGADVEKMNDRTLSDMLPRTSVFARMTPNHKMRIARLLLASGEVVAMTGDGVNDAPALRVASIGVALGSGTEVAKEASDLVLLSNSFRIIVAAIEEGRRIIDNLRKIVAYLLSTSGGEIIVVGGALALGLPLPLLPAQILWTNILSEGFMNFSFAFEPKESDLMRRNPKQSSARTMLSHRLMVFVTTLALSSGALLLLLYWYLVKMTDMSLDGARTVMFIALTLVMVFSVFSLKDLRAPIWKTRLWNNPYIFVSIGITLLGLFLALFVPPITDMLRLVHGEATAQPFLFTSVVVANILAIELAKYLIFSRRTHS